jgi:hypothetical protein
MNNSDFNDFMNWQNGDEEPPKNFFYYGPWNEKFREMWNKMHQNIDKNEYAEQMKDYMNIDDIMKDVMNNSMKKNKENSKPSKNRIKKTIFNQDDYLKLIEIRGYLAITEQYAHVKALDKLLNEIIIIPKESR